MEQYTKIKEQILEHEPVFKKIDIKNIYFENNFAEINGKSFKIKQDFKNNLMIEIGIKSSTIGNLKNNLSNLEIDSILNKSFNNYFKKNNAIRGNIIGERKSATLFRFTKNGIITYKTIFEALDIFHKNYSDFELRKSLGEFSILMRDNSKIKIKDMPDEAFTSNIGIKYDYGKTFGLSKIRDRLVCTNQIVEGFRFNDKKIIQLRNSNSIVKALQTVKENSIEEDYINLVKIASNYNASQNEYEQIINMTSKYTGRNNIILDNLFNKQEIDDYLKSINYNKKDAEKIKVPIKYWSLINGLTDFASHDYIKLKYQERDKLQQNAYTMLKKKPDLYKLALN